MGNSSPKSTAAQPGELSSFSSNFIVEQSTSDAFLGEYAIVRERSSNELYILKTLVLSDKHALEVKRAELLAY